MSPNSLDMATIVLRQKARKFQQKGKLRRALRMPSLSEFLKSLISLIRASTTGMSALLDRNYRIQAVYSPAVYFAMVGVTIYFFDVAVHDFWRYEVTTITEVRDRSTEGIAMPTLTFCNVGGFKKSVFCSEENLEYSRELCEIKNRTKFAGRFMNAFDDAEFVRIAHDATFSLRDQVLSCFFGGKECDETLIQEAQGYFARYGQCHCIFCDQETIDKFGRVRGDPSVDGGLSLVLRNYGNETLGAAATTGYVFMIHYPGTAPDVNSDGIYVSGETTTTIGLSVRVYHRLPDPYTTGCDKEYSPDYLTDMFGLYVPQICFKIKLSSQFFDECQNVPEVKDVRDYLDSEAMCALDDDAEECCQGLVRRVSAEDCPLVCTETSYSKQISVSGRQTHSPRNSSVTFSRVLIFFTTLETEIITEIPRWSLMQLVNLLGGYMGMFVGFSFLIFFEIGEILIRACIWSFRRPKTIKL